MKVKFLWLNYDHSLGAEICVQVDIPSIESVEDRQKAYAALAKIVGEKGASHCVLA